MKVLPETTCSATDVLLQTELRAKILGAVQLQQTYPSEHYPGCLQSKKLALIRPSFNSLRRYPPSLPSIDMRKSSKTPTTRSTRLRRQCSRRLSQETDRFPGLMEEIEVLWRVGNGTKWWKADVIEINIQSTSPRRAATAKIRYIQHEKYVAEDYAVTLVRPSSGSKFLRHTFPSSTDLVSWKFPNEVLQIMEEPTIPGAKSPISKERNKSQDKVHVESQPSSSAHKTDTVIQRASNTEDKKPLPLLTPSGATNDDDEMYVINQPLSSIRFFLSQNITILT